MKITINWTDDKLEKTKQIIEIWMTKYGCYSSEHAQQCDKCWEKSIYLVGDLADLLVEHDWEDGE